MSMQTEENKIEYGCANRLNRLTTPVVEWKKKMRKMSREGFCGIGTSLLCVDCIEWWIKLFSELKKKMSIQF